MVPAVLELGGLHLAELRVDLGLSLVLVHSLTH